MCLIDGECHLKSKTAPYVLPNCTVLGVPGSSALRRGIWPRGLLVGPLQTGAASGDGLASGHRHCPSARASLTAGGVSAGGGRGEP